MGRAWFYHAPVKHSLKYYKQNAKRVDHKCNSAAKERNGKKNYVEFFKNSFFTNSVKNFVKFLFGGWCPIYLVVLVLF